LKQLLLLKNLCVSDNHDNNLDTLRQFCRLEYGPDHLKQAQTPYYQPLANALYVECYKRRVAATNEGSQRLPMEYRGIYKYACEWRYGSAMLVVLITVCLTFRFYLGRE
jgi:hypothetical protein